MKIRAGFVSNSSTSSYILVGIKPLDYQLKEWRERHPGWEDDGDENGPVYRSGYNDGIIGVQFSSREGVREVRMKELEDALAAVRKEFGETADIHIWHWAGNS